MNQLILMLNWMFSMLANSADLINKSCRLCEECFIDCKSRSSLGKVWQIPATSEQGQLLMPRSKQGFVDSDS
jgi:hypothetical protein